MAKIVVRLPEPKQEYDISNQKQINRAVSLVVEQLNSIDKRLATILRTEQRKKKKGLELSQELINRRKELEDLRAQESAAASDLLESQRRGRRPGTGGGGPGISDKGAPAGTGGYSYDSGGRQGYGYGL